MKLHTLVYECILNASAQKVCAFHTDPHNLSLITPPWIKVKIIAMETPMREKSRIVLQIKRFGFKTNWEIEISTLDCPNTVTDTMISGPFRFFRHERRFIPMDENTTLMRESLSFALPLGWIGNLFYGGIKKDIDAMFAYRHDATQVYFFKKESL